MDGADVLLNAPLALGAFLPSLDSVRYIITLRVTLFLFDAVRLFYPF